MLKRLEKKEALELYHHHIIQDFTEKAFPPYYVYEKAIEDQKYIALQYKEDGEAKAYFIYREKENHLLLLFFAVHKETRGKGIGTRAIQEFIEQYKNKEDVFIEVEKEEETSSEEEKQMIQRRINFYEKIGFQMVEKLEYKIKKEPYHIMMITKKDKTASKVKDILYYMYEDLLRDMNWLEIKLIK